MKKTMFLAIFLLFCFVGAASANLIQNGDFENGFSDWTAGDHLSVVSDSGNNYALFEATKKETSYLSQQFYLNPSLSAVTVAFDFFFNSGLVSANSFKSIIRIDTTVSSGFDDVTRIMVERDPTSGWDHVSMDISLQDLVITDFDPNAKLVFSLWDFSDDWAKARLDNVNVTSAPVPEPATVLLLGSGLVGLAWYRRKRKKS